MTKIAFILPYPHNTAPSQRFRHELFLPFLVENNLKYDLYPFLNKKAWSILYKNGYTILKIMYVIKGYFSRVMFLFRARKYDYIYIHREATPFGPPFFEWILAKVIERKIVFDFDDAIYLKDDSNRKSLIKWLKNVKKTQKITSWAYRVSVGNQFLAEWAKNFNKHTYIIPTVVDTENYHNKSKEQKENKKLTIGWTGSHSTLVYLDSIIPVIKNLYKEIDFRFLVIADKNPRLPLKNFEFRKWKKNKEIEDLLNFNIGIMPLKSTDWAKGKCGFKAIQYMSLGIPAVVSDVGVNSKIVDDNENGFLARNSQEWYNYLKLLLINNDLRTEFGQKARVKIKNEYSVEAVKGDFINLFT